MGDENSLAGRTQAHKHESASSTGGYLDEGLTGFQGGAVGEVLTATATDIPVWSPVVASGGMVQLVGTTTALVTAPNGYDGLHLTFASIDMTAVTELIAIVTASRDTNSLGFLWNGVTSGYKYGGYVTSTAGSGTAFGGSSASLFEIGHWQVGTVQSLTIHITLNENDDKFNVSGTAGGNDGGSFAGGGDNNVSTTCDSVSFIESGRNMPAGNHRLTVYKVER